MQTYSTSYDTYDDVGIVRAGEEVKRTLETNGWKEYIAPLLDKMITDIVGGKDGDRWVDTPPKLNEKTIPTEEFRYLLGYKAALITLHNRIYGIIDDADLFVKEKARVLQDPMDEYKMGLK